MYSMFKSVAFLVFYMTFSKLKNFINIGKGILETIDFKILLGSMPLDHLDISHALRAHSVHRTFVTVGHHWRPRRAPPPTFFAVPTPLEK